MEGRRFGVSLVVGLAFALGIVVAYGAVSPAGAPFPASSLVSTVTTANSSGGPVPSAVSSTTATVPYQFALSSNRTTSQSNLNSLGSGVNSSGAQTPGPTPGFSSSLANATQLPTASRALLLAPVVLAFIVGAILYQASRRGHQDED